LSALLIIELPSEAIIIPEGVIRVNS